MKISHAKKKSNGNGHKVNNDIVDLSLSFPTENTVSEVTTKNKWLSYPEKEYQVVIEPELLKELHNILSTVNEHFGTECTLNKFVNISLKDKVEKLSRFNN